MGRPLAFIKAPLQCNLSFQYYLHCRLKYYFILLCFIFTLLKKGFTLFIRVQLALL